MHALAFDGARLIGHGSVVQRRLRARRPGAARRVRGGGRGRTALQRRGHAAAIMDALERLIRGAYDLGALSATADGAGLYLARGWQPWRGPTSALTPAGTVPTPEDDGSVFVLPVSAVLDPAGELDLRLARRRPLVGRGQGRVRSRISVPGTRAPRPGDHWPQSWVRPGVHSGSTRSSSTRPAATTRAPAQVDRRPRARRRRSGGARRRRSPVVGLDVGRPVEVGGDDPQVLGVGGVGERPAHRVVDRGDEPAARAQHRATSVRAPSTSATNGSPPKAEQATSMLASANGSAPASACTRGTAIPVDRFSSAARASIPAERSSATTSAPACRSQRAQGAEPQPISRTRRPATSPEQVRVGLAQPLGAPQEVGVAQVRAVLGEVGGRGGVPPAAVRPRRLRVPGRTAGHAAGGRIAVAAERKPGEGTGAWLMTRRS